MKYLKDAVKKKWVLWVQWGLGSIIMLMFTQITGNSLANGERVKPIPKKVILKVDTLPFIYNKYHPLIK